MSIRYRPPAGRSLRRVLQTRYGNPMRVDAAQQAAGIVGGIDGGTILDGSVPLDKLAAGIDTLGDWTPITSGDPASPEILFDAEGDCVVGFVPTPGGV